jgi:hypothetical protein
VIFWTELTEFTEIGEGKQVFDRKTGWAGKTGNLKTEN